MRQLFFIMSLFISTALQAESVLKNTQGEDILFSSLKGKWVFINYWASWCGPCVYEIPLFNAFYEANKTAPVAVFAVNYDASSKRQQEQLIKQFDIRYPSLTRQSVATLHLGDIRAVPMTFVFNPEGEWSTTLYGGQTLASLNEVIHSSEMEPPLR